MQGACWLRLIRRREVNVHLAGACACSGDVLEYGLVWMLPLPQPVSEELEICTYTPILYVRVYVTHTQNCVSTQVMSTVHLVSY